MVICKPQIISFIPSTDLELKAVQSAHTSDKLNILNKMSAPTMPECAVCLDTIKGRTSWFNVCIHEFCESCIENWYKTKVTAKWSIDNRYVFHIIFLSK